ncbi:DUF4252 domain-containing protein [Dysgonomonas sp. 216]|uniref:DUF4252 domain-containing protein n=1 Tax=Dysgonomonas sp. 216 TaxID=2302934 RepID=UPI0013D433E6|nr:DUF4252 domain-containing protein [Dysgonomonas sp. 216]NDW18369.1 DUF4252 domain-containing protein [Dysgonomonas sp. 216]
MKKNLLLLFVLLFLSTHISIAKNAEKFLDRFAGEKQVELVSLSGSLLKSFKNSLNESSATFESLKVLMLKSCDDKIKKQFEKEVEKLKLDGYETLVRKNGDDETVIVNVKIEDDTVKSLFVAKTGSEPLLVLIKGNIHKSEINSVVANF